MSLTPSQQQTYDDMSMAEKVAVFLMQLGEDITATIFAYIDVETITEISKYIAGARSIDRHIGAAILEEFYAIFQSNQFIIAGGLEQAKEILYKVLGPEEAKKIIDKLSRSLQQDDNFNYISKVKPQQLADFIVNEHPQTIALILAHMDATNAAETLSFFSGDLRAEVSIRMANLNDISPTIISKVSKTLENKLEALTSYKTEVGGPRAVAEVFNRLGQKAAKATLTYIEQIDDKLATEIKDMMFTFEDIVKLDNNAIREILKVADKKDLSLALKSANEELKQKFMGNMSQRAAETFIEEMQFLGAVKVKDVESGQRKVVESVQRLLDEGVIQIGEEEEMVE